MKKQSLIKYESPSECVKRSYKSENIAKKKATMENDGLNWSAYECSDCRMWHIGHTPKKKEDK